MALSQGQAIITFITRTQCLKFSKLGWLLAGLALVLAKEGQPNLINKLSEFSEVNKFDKFDKANYGLALALSQGQDQGFKSIYSWLSLAFQPRPSHNFTSQINLVRLALAIARQSQPNLMHVITVASEIYLFSSIVAWPWPYAKATFLGSLMNLILACPWPQAQAKRE